MRTEKHNSFGRIKATLMLASAFSVAGVANAYETTPQMSMGESSNIHAVDQKNIKIKGVIVDGSGTPIIGANVIIEGTSVGSITGMDGDRTYRRSKKRYSYRFLYRLYHSEGEN